MENNKATQLYLQGDITDDRADVFIRKLLDCSGPIDIYISSLGGQLRASLLIYDMIKAHPHEVNTVVLTECHSAALLVLLAGDTRQCFNSSLIHLHEGNTTFDGDFTISEIKNIIAQIEEDFSRYDTIMVRETNLDYEVLGDLKSRGVYLNAPEMKHYGFINEIIDG